MTTWDRVCVALIGLALLSPIVVCVGYALLGPDYVCTGVERMECHWE